MEKEKENKLLNEYLSMALMEDENNITCDSLIYDNITNDNITNDNITYDNITYNKIESTSQSKSVDKVVINSEMKKSLLDILQ